MTTTEDRTCLRVARGWAQELFQKELVELRKGLSELRLCREISNECVLWSRHTAANSISPVALGFIKCRVSTLQETFQTLPEIRI